MTTFLQLFEKKQELSAYATHIDKKLSIIQLSLWCQAPSPDTTNIVQMDLILL